MSSGIVIAGKLKSGFFCVLLISTIPDFLKLAISRSILYKSNMKNPTAKAIKAIEYPRDLDETTCLDTKEKGNNHVY